MIPVRDNRALTRAALCLAVAAVAQALRVLLPLPPIASMLLIGTVVNLCLCFAVWGSGILYAGIICFLLPLFAFLQGHLSLLPMVAVVFLGNLVFCLVVKQQKQWKHYVFAPLLKAVTLWSCTGIVCNLFHVPRQVKNLLQISMGIPQWTTALLGVIAAVLLWKRLHQNGIV